MLEMTKQGQSLHNMNVMTAVTHRSIFPHVHPLTYVDALNYIYNEINLYNRTQLFLSELYGYVV